MSTELVIIEQNAVVLAFSKQGGTDELFERIESQVKSIVPDVSTKKGRDAIGSNSEKVSKSKVLVESYAKELVAEQKKQTKLVDDDRINFCKKMDALRKEILAPRDAYIQAEEDRVNSIKAKIKEFDSGRVDLLSSSDLIQTVIDEVSAIAIDDIFQEFANEAAIAKDAALSTYKKSLSAALKREAEQAELTRLRQEAIEREQAERDRKIVEDAANKARIEAEQKAAAEREEQSRKEAEAIAKAEQAKRDAEQERINAEREQARLVAEAESARLREAESLRLAEEAKVSALAKAKVDLEAAIEAERKRVEQERINTEAAEKKRLADVEHVRSINQSLVSSFLSLGISEDQAKSLIKAIAKGEIKHISIQY